MRIAVLDDYQDVARSSADWSPLADCELVSFTQHIADPRHLAESLAGFDVVVTMRERTPVTRDLLEALPDLRLLVTTGPFNAVIDTAAAGARGIPVLGTGGDAINAVELAWALVLATLRHVPAEDAHLRTGGWQHSVGGDLYGQTLGLLGLGNTGRRMARIAHAFEMDVIAWSEHLTNEEAAEHGVQRVEKRELFALADVLSVHLVLSDRTRDLVDADMIGAMPRHAILVNTSRGPIVDTGALVDALHAGRIAGAGLDVFDEEPLPRDHSLRSAPNTVLTPHLGYVTARMYRRFFTDIVDNIVQWRTGTLVRELA